VKCDAQLALADRSFQCLYGERLRQLFRGFTDVAELVADTRGFFAGGCEGSTHIQELLRDDEGGRLVAEAAFVAGLALMLLETQIPGEVRERILVAVFRVRMHTDHRVDDGWGGSSAEVYALCRRIDTPAASPDATPDWPSLFARVGIPSPAIRLIVHRAMESDLFQHHSVQEQYAGTATAATLFILLFFAPDLLQTDFQLMESIRLHCLRDTYVLPYFLGNFVDLSVSWGRYGAARRCLGKSSAHVAKLKKLTAANKQLAPGLLSQLEAMLVGAVEPTAAGFAVLSESHSVLQWALLQANSGTSRQRQQVSIYTRPSL
jgi:hypothetical protein